MSDDADKDKRLDRWITRWTHQNTLMWGRLQTMSAIQAGVLGGWYALWHGSEKSANNPLAALCLVALGIILSIALHLLIHRDNQWRDRCMQEARKYDNAPFNDNDLPGTSGSAIIMGISWLFVGINIVLFIFTIDAVVDQFAAYGCNCAN